MKIITENATLQDFKAWSGAIDRKDRIIEYGKAEEFDKLIEELYPNGITNGALNDLLWFDADWIYENLGIPSEDEE